MTLITRFCSTCGDGGEFEQPPCEDGHGPDCPEWACVRCGTALLLGTSAVVGEVRRVLQRRAA